MLLGIVALTVLVAVAGLVGALARPDDTASPASTPQPSPSAVPAPDTSTESKTSTVLDPPSTGDPLKFAKAAAVALWSYDTRAMTHPRHLAELHRWLTDEKKYRDRESVDAQVPSPVLWGQMADQDQYATARTDDARYPKAFSRALQEDPGAIKTAHIYAVTVSGKQKVAWDGSPRGGAESRTVTLAVQCRPSRPCALAGVLPTVAP